MASHRDARAAMEPVLHGRDVRAPCSAPLGCGRSSNGAVLRGRHYATRLSIWRTAQLCRSGARPFANGATPRDRRGSRHASQAAIRRDNHVAIGPRHVGGHDQGRHRARWAEGRGQGRHRVIAQALRRLRRPDERRDIAGHRLDVRLERGVVAAMRDGVVPTTFIIGLQARLALCRFARPLPSPGPRCSKVAAGLLAMRA